jgi:hypothetical protein
LNRRLTTFECFKPLIDRGGSTCYRQIIEAIFDILGRQPMKNNYHLLARQLALPLHVQARNA